MLYIKYQYSGKTFEISPYSTSQEKDLLLMTSVGNSNYTDALRVCGIDNDIIKSLTTDEKIAFLYKMREISVGEELNLKFKCNSCGTPNSNVLSITNVIESASIKNDHIKDQFKKLTPDNIQDFTSKNIDELDLDEYDELYKEIESSVTKFEFTKPITCQKCKAENKVKIDEPDFLLENMSEDSLMSIYQTYNDLTFHGNYTKADVDSFYPFERLIFVSLMNKTREDLNG